MTNSTHLGLQEHIALGKYPLKQTNIPDKKFKNNC